jgi:hypothetical protein
MSIKDVALKLVKANSTRGKVAFAKPHIWRED